MKRTLTILAMLLGSLSPVMSQAPPPPDDNEGSRLEYNSASNTFSFEWEGHLGRSYFVRGSEDLLTWHYLPLVATGGDDILGLGFSIPTSNQFFWSLRRMDYDPYATDSDNDGMTDAWEILNGLNPYAANPGPAPGGDGIPDWWKLLHFGDLNMLGSSATTSWNHDGVTNLYKYLNGIDPTAANGTPATEPVGGAVVALQVFTRLE